MYVSVAVASNEAEAEMICGRLAAEGISASQKAADIPQEGGGGARDVFVSEGEAERARAILEGPPFSDEELAMLSEQAAAEDESQ